MKMFLKSCILCLLIISAHGYKSVPLNAVDRILGDGYPLEVHDVTTDDGYILQMHRIPYSPLIGREVKPKGAVFVIHGFAASSDQFLYNGPHEALAYMLADAGYDVWLGNFRGNTYSKRHVALEPSSDKFWNFDFYEFAYYDNSNMIDYILRTTNRNSLHYIGHSYGTVTFFILMSERPTFNSKILSANLFAPIVRLGNSNAKYKDLICSFVESFLSVRNGHSEILPHYDCLGKILSEQCSSYYSAVSPFCAMAINAVQGNSTALNQTLLSSIFASTPAGTSSKVAQFVCQLGKNKFQRFDYGPKLNLLHYGNESPPAYNISKIKTPLYFYFGNSDPYTDNSDFEYLRNSVGKALKGITYLDEGLWAHSDFMFGDNVKTFVNTPVIERINANNK